MKDGITFSFGENWRDFVDIVTEADIEGAVQDLTHWLGDDAVKGKRVLDIGCGSGLHSLGFHMLNASSVRSFDYDPRSVAATRILWEKAGRPETWSISEGSVLDRTFLDSLGVFDVVYSWGVLHHTGAMWEAIQNASERVSKGGCFFISIYAKGPSYERDLTLKKQYNTASPFGKKVMVWRWVANLMLQRFLAFKNPFGWNEKRERGMNTYHDLIDWLGGLPYEVATEDEILVFLANEGFVLERIKVNGEGSCDIFVFRKNA